MGYEMSEELIEGYAKIILESDRDMECPRQGTYEEKVKQVHSELHSKDIKKKVDKRIDAMLRESRIEIEEYKEAMKIALEMKASGQT